MNSTNGRCMRQLLGVVAALGLMATPRPADAALITGTIGFSGGVVYDQQGTGEAAIIDFQPIGGGVGTTLIVGGRTGYFQAIDFGSMATIKDLTNTIALAGNPGPAYAPPGVLATPVVNFISNFTDTDASGLHFDLTEVTIQNGFPECTGTEGLGDTCVTGDSFVLTQTSEGLRIVFDVRGIWRRGIDESPTSNGSFSTTFTGLTFQTAFARLAAGQDLNCGGAECTWDANFTTVPEPATLLTFGTATALLGALRRRRAKKAQRN